MTDRSSETDQHRQAETVLTVDVPLAPIKQALDADVWGVAAEHYSDQPATSTARYVGPGESFVAVRSRAGSYEVRAGRRPDGPPLYAFFTVADTVAGAQAAVCKVLEETHPGPVPLTDIRTALPASDAVDDLRPAALPTVNGWEFRGQAEDLQLWTWENPQATRHAGSEIQLSPLRSGSAAYDWRVHVDGPNEHQRKYETLRGALCGVGLKQLQTPPAIGWQPGHGIAEA